MLAMKFSKSKPENEQAHIAQGLGDFPGGPSLFRTWLARLARLMERRKCVPSSQPTHREVAVVGTMQWHPLGLRLLTEEGIEEGAEFAA